MAADKQTNYTYHHTKVNPQYIKISSEFNLLWSIEELAQQFVDVEIPPGVPVYADPAKQPHWQLFQSRVAFARNFFANFPAQCSEAADQLQLLQHAVRSNSPDHPLVNKFLSHAVSADRVGIIRVLPGDSVDPHYDVTRNISINIGLKNSNAGTTYISNNKNIKQFWQQNLSSYTMQDGEVYLVEVKNTHAVKSNVNSDSGQTRYIITYSM